jgi:hypothetical protein
MIITNLLFLFTTIFGNLKEGEERWITLPLAESYEYQILEGKGALQLREYKKIFSEQGLVVKHMEIQRKLMVFKDEEALKQWIRLELAPCFEEDSEQFVNNYVALMQERGWLDFGDGKIRFPRQQLHVFLSRVVEHD